MNQYVHGYTPHETTRLHDQSQTLSELFYHDTRYAPGSRVLEAGCGVGAQTVQLLRRNPGIHLTSLDISLDSAVEARAAASDINGGDVRFLQANLFDLPFAEESFDHAFICFVLEHLKEPLQALRLLKKLIEPGGTITVIEGDHGSCYFHPRSEDAWRVWNCLIEAQARMGGDSLIGRRLYPLLYEVPFENVEVTPRVVYADDSRPAWVDGFTIKTICAMVAGVRDVSIEMGLVDEASWERGMKALRRTAQSPDGVFNYTFFKGTAVK